ncbi:MAG: potassium-transporting ATPase subunit F [Candidatus Omnitrophota bacterium]
MNVPVPPPDALGIPSPAFIFQFLMLLTYTLHVVFMNFVLGGFLIITINEWIFGKNPAAAKADSLLLKMMPVALSLAITMGVAPLLFVQTLYGNFFYSANVIMGWHWMSILALVMIAFYLIYIAIAKRPEGATSSLWTSLIAIVNTILFFMVAFLFTNNAVLTENPAYWANIYSGAKSVAAPDSSLWQRYLHNISGALAVAGMWCAAVARYRRRYDPADAETTRWLHRSGLLWAIGGTLAAMATGFLYLVFLGGDRIKAFMSIDALFIGWAISVVVTFVLLVFLIMALMQPEKSIFLWSGVGLMSAALFGMAMGREHLRMVSLKPYFTMDQLTLNPSYSSLAMFLITFVLGLLVLGYLIRLVYALPESTEDDT